MLPVLQRAVQAGYLFALLFLTSCPSQQCRTIFTSSSRTAGLVHIQTQSQCKKFCHLFCSYSQAFVYVFLRRHSEKMADSNCKLIPCENVKPQSGWNVCVCSVQMLSTVTKQPQLKKQSHLSVLQPGLVLHGQ